MFRLLGFLVLFFGQLVATGSLAADGTEASPVQERQKRVLVLNSYAQGYKWTDTEVHGITEALSGGQNVVLRIEYMDTKNINTDRHFELLRSLYENKYRDYSLDLIVATDDDALRFLRRHRDELFPGVPVVFTGINNFSPAKVEGFDRYTGCNEAADFPANLSLMLTLHPNTKRVFVINDQLTTARSLKREFDLAARAYYERIEVIYLDDLTMQELKDRLRSLEPDSLVFYLSFFQDAAGVSYAPEEALPQISAASSRPIYGSVDYMLGFGVVGGMMRSGFHQGKAAGDLAWRVLQGEDIDSIPVITESPNHYMFDYEPLHRFRINPRTLPAGSIIINEPQTFYYKYKELIWTVFLVIIALVVYIVVLLFNIKKRVRAQRGLQAIIDSAASFLTMESYDKMKAALASQLRAMLPMTEKVVFYRPSAGADGVVEAPMNADPSEGRADMRTQNGSRSLAKATRALFCKSIEEKKSAFSNRELVAYLDNAIFPDNLLYVRGKRKFDDLDRDLTEIFTSTISLALESIEKHKIEESLETARQIQMSMLPKLFDRFSDENNVDLYAFLSPAKEVGGDLYDFFSVDDDHICVTVGDVSDKGVPAALFMAMAKTLIRSAAEAEREPANILYRVNNELLRDNTQAMFVTVFLAILNKKTGHLRFANAGHNPPYLLRSGGVAQLDTKPGVILGAFPKARFFPEETQLEPGDGLFIYSDGVTEARSEQHELYEESRLEQALHAHATESAQSIIEGVIEDVCAFAAGEPQSDDITALFVRLK